MGRTSKLGIALSLTLFVGCGRAGYDGRGSETERSNNPTEAGSDGDASDGGETDDRQASRTLRLQAQSTDSAGTIIGALTRVVDFDRLSSTALPASVRIDSDGFVELTESISSDVSGSVVVSDRSGDLVPVELRVSVTRITESNVVTWGENQNNVLLDATRTTVSLPNERDDLALSFRDISIANDFACGLLNDGAAYCWGSGEHGQLGTNSTEDASDATRVDTSLQFRSIAVTSDTWSNSVAGHTCALSPEGRAYCWGSNVFGQLGDGTREDRAAPTAVSTDQRFEEIHAGENHTCALAFSGQISCWGRGSAGQLGDGGFNDALTPRPIDAEMRFADLAVGATRSCALSDAGELLCWGYRDFVDVELIQDDAPERTTWPSVSSPRPYGEQRPYVSLEAGGSSTCAIDEDGGVWCFGHAMYGRLGIGNYDLETRQYTDGIDFNTIVNLPRAVNTSARFKLINIGLSVTCGISTTDAMWCWGRNDQGVDGNLGLGYFSGSGGSVALDDPRAEAHGPFGKYSPVLIDASRRYRDVSIGRDAVFGIPAD
ncbi:MAG: hypothetical protein AAFZ38_01690 [Myxococcota bacterium]